MSRSRHPWNSAEAVSGVAMQLPRRGRMAWRVGLGLTWLVAFSVWFSGFGLPNNPPAERWAVWFDVPFALLDLIDPPANPNGSSNWSWLSLSQRVPFLFVAGIVWLGAWALGAAASRILRIRSLFTPSERLFFSGCLGLAIVSLTMLGFGLAGWLSRGPLLALFGIAIGLELSFQLRETRSGDRRILGGTNGQLPGTAGSQHQPDPLDPLRWLRWTALFMMVPFVFCLLLGAMSPQTDFDVIAYHLGGPKEWFQQGRITWLPHNVYTSFPFLTEMLLLSGMVLYGDWEWGALAGQAAVAGFTPLTAIGLYATGKRWFNPTAGALAALVWLTTPWAYRISIIAYAEGGLACYLLGSLAVGIRLAFDSSLADQTAGPDVQPISKTDTLSPVTSGSEIAVTGGVVQSTGVRSPTASPALSLCLLGGLLAGSGMACKYTGAVSAVIPLAVMIALRGIRGTGSIHLQCRRRTLELACFGLSVLVAVGPWLLKNTLETGNPVFPLAYSIFGGEGRDASLDAQWCRGHATKTYVNATDRLNDLVVKLTDVTANNDWHSALMFGLAPVALMSSWRRRIWYVWAFVGWQFLSWWLFTHHIDRFYVPMLPAVALLAGAGAALLVTTGWGRWCGGLLVVLQILFNVWIMAHVGGYNAGRTDLNVARDAVVAPIFKWLETELDAGRLPPKLKVLCVGDTALFHARFPYEYNTVFNRSLLEDLCVERTSSGAGPLRPGEEIRARLHERGITHILVNWSEILRFREPGSYGYTDFVHPDRFGTLRAAGVIGPPLPLPAEVGLSRLSDSRRQQIEAWAPELLTSFGGEPAYFAVQVFPVKP